MSPDDFQKAWRAEASQTRVTIDADLLRTEVLRAQRDFRATIRWRDFREVGVGLLMIPFWFYAGFAYSLPWTWYLTVPALLWIIGFIAVDRVRHKQRPGEAGDSLVISVTESLTQVEHQIWLLRNVGWWYVMPFTISGLAFFFHVSWMASRDWTEAVVMASGFSLFLISIHAFVYFLNVYTVRKRLEPQRDELLALLASLGDERADEVSGEYPILMGANRVTCSPRRMVVACLCSLALLSIGIGGSVFLANYEDDYPKLAPFTDVLWRQDTPVVQVDGELHLLFSINGIEVKEIVAFCQRTYGEKWQKRFGEDLVQVLTEMGHAPEETVRMEVMSTGSEGARTVKEVAMTKANRNAVRAAGEEREAAQEGMKSQRADTVEELGTSAPLAETLEAIRASYKLPAMAAFALRDGAIVERAIVGARSTKDNTPLGDDAQWHLGSNTKAMTATVAGMLVEEGLLQWDSTVGEVLGKAAPDMDAAHRDTTLAMLLHHTSGIAANINWFVAPKERVACVAKILAESPEGKRGEYAYSNAGYVVAGAMMEVTTGKRWEDLMQEKLFGPLGMTNTGFGAPSKPGSPWGHESGLFGWSPKDPASRGSDNAPVLGPAGTVHGTLEDYARFIAAHLKGAQGQGGIVSAETFKTLHAPLPGGDYGMGWIITERDWAGGRALTHGGSNTLWFATVWIAPEKDMAFFAVTNAGGDKAFEAVDKAIGAMIGRHLPSDSSPR